MWLDATRVSTAPGSSVSRTTFSPVTTAASARVVGMPNAAIASLTTYSRRTGPSAARPSPRRENGVGREPFSWTSRRTGDGPPAERGATLGARWSRELAALIAGRHPTCQGAWSGDILHFA